MRLLQMSLAGGILILAITAVRAVFINKLPKRTFLVLWGIALLRLLVPVSIPSALSVYTFARQGMEIAGISGGDLAEMALFPGQTEGLGAGESPGEEGLAGTENRTKAEGSHGAVGEMARRLAAPGAGKPLSDSGSRTAEGAFAWQGRPSAWKIFGMVWGIGAMLWAVYFGMSVCYLRRKYGMALPIEDPFLGQWLEDHRLRREVKICASHRISTPMTYGIFHPVILLPGKLDLTDREQLTCILTHEYMHIRRFDTVTKLAAALALCLHWPNPLVWVMYILLNRDLELACDEGVVRRLGMESRSVYALALIQMEERKSGLVPLGNHFSKNAIEERITAIMKIKKITFGAVLLATVLVASVATVFATSAAGKKQSTQSVSTPGPDFTEEEWERLEQLRFDGYEDMSVAQFQDRAWKLMDQPEYRDTIERFSMDDALYEMRDSNETASFLFYVLEPLTAEKWKTRSFGGSVATEYPGTADNAMLEYSLTLVIWDADNLTVKEYCDARLGITGDLHDWFLGRTAEELQDADLMWNLMLDDKSGEIPRLTEKWGSESLDITIAPFYMPLVNADVPSGFDIMKQNLDDEILNRMSQEQRQAEWDENMAPYVSFGLRYEYNQSTDDFKLYFQGKEVRGLVDEERGMWFTEHAGIGTYGKDAVELYAVYEHGELTGLREATGEEQKTWTETRQKNSDSLQTGEEEDRGMPGTEEDYLSLLALKTADYEDMPLAEFNQALLTWADADYDRMERIGMDAAWNDIQVPLQEDALSFVRLTVILSGLENGEQIRENYRGWEQDPVHDQYLPDKLAINEGMGAWCSLYYQFSYHIDDMDAVTVGERDRCIGGMMEGIEEFWEETDMEDMLQMEEEDVVARLQEIAAKWSNEHITISIREDKVGFERMDERGIQRD